MVNEPVIKAVRVVCVGTAVLSFAFAAVSIPLPNRAAAAPPTLPPPVKIVYRHASNPFRLEYAGLDPVSDGPAQHGTQIIANGHFPSLPVGMMPPLPAGKHVPGISGMGSALSLTGIVLGRKPLAMIRENNVLRTVGVGDVVGGSKITHISASAVRLANGMRIVPGVAPTAPEPKGGFVFPSTVPNGSDKGELPSSIANPNGLPSVQPTTADGSASPTPVQQQQNVLQQVQDLTPTAAPGAPAAPAATTGTTSSGVPPNSTSPGSAATPATQSH